MHALLRLVSRYLLLVMLATVFSPSFGWEAVQGMEAHDDMAAMQVHDGGALAADEACSDCPGHEHDSCPDTLHHCCPGHVLGHLPGSIADGLSLAVPSDGSAAVDAAKNRFSTRTPDGLERPPRASAA